MNTLDKKQNLSFELDEHSVSVKASTVVKLNEYFTIYTIEGPVDFKVDIISDFADVPKQYHEICLNTLTSKYLNKASFGRNPFSECKPVVRRKWYQFWKPRYSESN